MMDAVRELFGTLTTIQWRDVLDILLVTYLIYRVVLLVRSTSAMRIAKGFMAILVISAVTQIQELWTLNFLLGQILSIGLLALVILFQPELRRMMDHLGSSVSLRRFLTPERELGEMDMVISQTVKACEIMGRERVGALIVFARTHQLDEYFKTGTVIDSRVSEQLIRNIFFPKAALHDGAMIIRDGRIAAAGCVMPLSDSHRLSADLGTRHRAGVGTSEASDAVVVIVSEETGTISVAVGGMLKRHLAPQTLERLLRQELIREEANKAETKIVAAVKDIFTGKEEKRNDKK
ncbi:MAG: diadenylate cyclase CdaA [Oscillospiraceae bacterium]|nr:diadenylate cyclase CdaA [Oscillospiraceae bacterium]